MLGPYVTSSRRRLSTAASSHFTSEGGKTGKRRSVPSRSFHLVPASLGEKERALLLANDDVRQPVAIEVGGHHLRADVRGIVAQMRKDFCMAFGGSVQLEPIRHRRSVWFLLHCRTVLSKVFAGSNVFEAVGSHVHQIKRKR